MAPGVAGFAGTTSSPQRVKKIPSAPPRLRPPPRRPVVNSSMIAAGDFVLASRFPVCRPPATNSVPTRHTTCCEIVTAEKVSRSRRQSVNFPVTFAKSHFPRDVRWLRTDGVERAPHARHHRWNQGAAGYGCRKRTHVREACGDTIRPGGVGIHCSHGHSGRSVGRFRLLPSVVQRLPGGHPSLRSPLSRGPGLLAALTTRDVGFVRMPAPAGRTALATRRRSPVVTRAASRPAHPVGTSGGWQRRTRPDPRTRLRTV